MRGFYKIIYFCYMKRSKVWVHLQTTPTPFHKHTTSSANTLASTGEVRCEMSSLPLAGTDGWVVCEWGKDPQAWAVWRQSGSNFQPYLKGESESASRVVNLSACPPTNLNPSPTNNSPAHARKDRKWFKFLHTFVFFFMLVLFSYHKQ